MAFRVVHCCVVCLVPPGSVQPEHAAEEKKPAPLAGSLEVVLQGGGSLGDQKR